MYRDKDNPEMKGSDVRPLAPRPYRGVAGYDGYGEDEYGEVDYRALGVTGAQETGNSESKGTTGSEQHITVLSAVEPEEIVMTAQDIQKYKRRYSNLDVLVRHLNQNGEKTKEFHRYVEFLYQDYTKLYKRIESLFKEYAKQEEAGGKSTTRGYGYSTYQLLINPEDENEVSYPLKYGEYIYEKPGDYSTGRSTYRAFRVPITRGDIIAAINYSNQPFNFKGGIIGDKAENFRMNVAGEVMCVVSGVYDIEVRTKFGDDIVCINSAEKSVQELINLRNELKELARFSENRKELAIRLYDQLSLALDEGKEINSEVLDEVLKSWQKLAKIRNFQLYAKFEARVRQYGTSY